MLLSLIESIGYCLFSGVAVGSIGGIDVFWIEKWLLSSASAAAILFVSLLFRNKGLGFLFACLLGTSGLVMGVEWGLEALHVPGTELILSMTMYGASTVPTLQFNMVEFLHVLLASAVWTVFYSVLSAIMLKMKDV